MSDSSIIIVPKKSSYPNNEEKAKEILNWLISRDIVKPTPSDCVLGSENGYEVSEGARSITDSSGMAEIEFDKKGNMIEKPMHNYIPTDMLTNGLEIITKRTVFYDGEGYVEEITCPNCKSSIEMDNFDFNSWQDGNNNVKCPHCSKESEINEYKFEPEWGFSDLGFKFWNWPNFKDEFLDEFRNKLNCEIRVVEERL